MLEPAESIVHKIRHYLLTGLGITLEEATDEEVYRALVFSLREEITIHWAATRLTYKKKQARMLYYLCMEYMPGRFLGSALKHMQAETLVLEVLGRIHRDAEAIFSCESDPGLGNGGLGRLASCFLDSLATLHYPTIAYGLRYQYGIFAQEMWNGIQIERPEKWLFFANPWEYRRDLLATSVFYSGTVVPRVNKKQLEVESLADYEEVRAVACDLPIVGYNDNGNLSVNTLRLWSTKESPRNFQLQRYNAGALAQAAENSSLTDVLYPNDNNETGKRIRLKQEFLLVASSLQDILRDHIAAHNRVNNLADKVRIHLNDTHPALAVCELMRLLTFEYDFSWQEAWETVSTCCNFTNHTVMREALEEWDQNKFRFLLPRQYHIIEKINFELCNATRIKFPAREDLVQQVSILEHGVVRMAHLAVYGAAHVNGVAALHSEILKKDVFKEFAQLTPDKFTNVTNGITQRRWLLHANPLLAEFITNRIGKGWILDLNELAQLKEFSQNEQALSQFMELKQQNKRRLIQFLVRSNPVRDDKGRAVGCYPLDENALFDVQIKRVHEYKRQLMNVLHLITIYHELKQNPIGCNRVKRVAIFAGKAAPGYEMAKRILRFIWCVARTINSDPDIGDRLRVVLVENYNVSCAEKIIPTADLSEQISTAGLEASGTGNMKLSLNGALTIGTEDGANIELRQEVTDAWWPFRFGHSAQENAQTWVDKSYDPMRIYAEHSHIQQAMDSLQNHTFAVNEEEHNAHLFLFNHLLRSEFSNMPDRFFVLRDFLSYYETQKKVEVLYRDKLLWAKYALLNVASMGHFSSDRSIREYAKNIWGLEPCLVDLEERRHIEETYRTSDRCRIL